MLKVKTIFLKNYFFVKDDLKIVLKNTLFLKKNNFK